MSRLQVFWSNCIIIRKLFELMFPGQVLHWVGYDQKPLWFNAISAERTYAIKGQKKGGVAENVSASRARFTAMTSVQDWRTETPPGIGVLFRIGGAACSLDNMRGALTADDHTLVQGAEKGSMAQRINLLAKMRRKPIQDDANVETQLGCRFEGPSKEFQNLFESVRTLLRSLHQSSIIC